MSDDKSKTAIIGQLTQYMIQHKLRKTPERYAILEKVMDMDSHFLIDTLYSALESDGYHVSRATVYNTMELLVEAGLVRRHIFGTKIAQYEKIVGPTNHHHLVCSHCGRVRDIKDSALDALIASRHFTRFQPAYVDLSIYGICSKCQQKKRKSK